MSTLSIRLPDDVAAQLTREAERAQRPKSDVARDAIIEYLRQAERERFLSEIARAARSGGEAEAIESAEEALPFDNEALSVSESPGVREPRGAYSAQRTGRKSAAGVGSKRQVKGKPKRKKKR